MAFPHAPNRSNGLLHFRAPDVPVRDEAQLRAAVIARPDALGEQIVDPLPRGASARGDIDAHDVRLDRFRIHQARVDLLEAFRETETGEECPKTKSFFGKIRTALGG